MLTLTRRLRPFLIAICCLSAATQNPPVPRIPVLILTGENGTDWRWTSTWMHSVLEDSGKFDVEVSLYPDGSLADPAFLERFDVVLLDYEGARWGEPAEGNFLELVNGGTGVVAVGNAARAFPDWDGYHAVLGCDWDEAGGADPFGPTKIRGKEQHDIAIGFGDWSDHQDTLLLGIEPRTETHEVLGLVDRVDPLTGETHELPVVLLGQYGSGRVVTSTLGHVAWGDQRTWASQTDPQYQQFLIRACEWAATGETSTISRMEPNTLTDADRAAGWQLLFDGESMQGWSDYAGEGMPEQRWHVQNGVLVVNPMEGDRVLAGQIFEEFEVELDWKVAEGQGADLRLEPEGEGEGLAYDLDHTDRTGASLRILRPAGEFNHARIVATRDGVEQWLNGVKLATHRMTPAEWAYRMTGDRPKADPELAGKMPLLKLVLENEGAAVWFRNLKIRRIESEAPVLGGEDRDDTIELFNGRDLEGWTWVPQVPSNAPGAFRAEDGLLIDSGLPIGYLRTDATYGDFELELDWRTNPVNKQTGPGGLMLRIQARQTQGVQEMFWPPSLDVRVGTNEAGNLVANRAFPMQADPRRFNGMLARSLRNMEHRAGEWNHVIVRLEAGELVVILNGEVVNSASAVGGEPGWIGLRAEGTELQFRGLKLTPLGD